MKAIIVKFQNLINDRDFIAKIVSLILAVFLWAYISSTKTGELKFRIPVELQNVPTALTISNISSRHVIVVIEGRKEIIKSINTRNIKAYADLANPRLNTPTKYPIEIVRNQIPESVKITPLQKSITVTIENKVEKRIRVVPNIVGNVKQGFVLGKYRVEPEYILIKGPQSILEKTENIYTENISIENETDVVSKLIDLDKSRLPDISFSEIQVKVTIPIMKFGSLLSISVPIIIRNPVKEYRYVLKKKNATIYIKSDNRDKVGPENFNVFVDVSSLKVNDFEPKNENEYIEKEIEVNAFFKDEIEKTQIVSYAPEKTIIMVYKRSPAN